MSMLPIRLWTVSEAEKGNTTTLKANSALITQNGDLVFESEPGVIKWAYASGQWHKCSLLEPSIEDRLVIIEDTGELQCTAKNAVTMRSC